MKRILGLVALLILSACGGKQELKPKEGMSLPPKPAVAKAVPTPDELLTPDDQARPKRSDELLIKSEKRRDDPFDLPPKR